MTTIKFGTDGWRGLIAHDFTFEAVTRAALGMSHHLKKTQPHNNKLLIGYDRRFLSKEFSQAVACVFAQQGYRVLLSDTFMPTPVLSWCAKHTDQAVGSIVITASHNPPQWNGLKFKETFGGSALPLTTEAFEQAIAKVKPQDVPAYDNACFTQCLQQESITYFNPMASYCDSLKGLLDLKAIKQGQFKVALDCMFGSASKHFSQLLNELGVETRAIHECNNPGFHGTPPEPIEKNLGDLCRLVKQHGYACGLATDGDADRLGAVDEHGDYFSTQKILSVVYWHMLKNRGKKWNIARSVSTTRMVDLIAQAYQQTCIETPVGFKFIAEKIVQGQAHIGGEESGGIGIIDHVPERDGFLTGLLLLEVMATTGKGLAEIYSDICRDIRPYQFVRVDLHVAAQVMTRALERLQRQTPHSWGQRQVERVDLMDGYKFYLTDGSWLLIRASGTEPIFRIYAETESLAESQALAELARQFVEEGA